MAWSTIASTAQVLNDCLLQVNLAWDVRARDVEVWLVANGFLQENHPESVPGVQTSTHSIWPPPSLLKSESFVNGSDDSRRLTSWLGKAVLLGLS